MNAISAYTSMGLVMHAQQRPPDFRRLGSMPFRSFLRLGALRSAPGSARGHAVNVLTEWGLRYLEHSVAVVISELLTNAVLATEELAWPAGPPSVGLWLRGAPNEVYVLVEDAVSAAPVPRVTGDLDESGRGLSVVVPEYSADWGWYEVTGGKVTWALITSP
jgi:hypothetical protein